MLQRSHERVGFVLAVVVIVLSPLCIGAQHTWVLLAATAISAVSAVLFWATARPRAVRQSSSLLVWLAVALTAFTLLQAVPLPISLLRIIAPKSADVWSRALTPLGEGVAWGALSIDPTATRIQALRGILYLTMLLSCLRIAMRREGIEKLLWVLTLVALVVGVSAIAHPLFGLTRVFGIYEIVNSAELRHIAPLPNPNHLAGYLNVGIATAIGLGMHAEAGKQRIIPIAIAALLAAIQVWVASRGGVASMILVLLASAWVHRRAFTTVHRGTAFALAGLTAITAAFVVALADDARNELFDSDSGKLRSFVGMLPVIKAYPLWGAGRGAFESAFAEYRTGVGHIVFAQPENLIVQWIAEWGPFVGTASMLLTLFALRLREVMARPEVARGAWVALVGAFVHNMGDFNSEVPGIAVAFVVCAACVTAGVGADETRLTRWSKAPRRVAIFAAMLFPLALGLGALTLGKSIDEDRRALRARVDGRETPETLVPALRASMLRHPGEPFLPYLGALNAYHHKKRVVPWVGRTLERAPIYGRAHFVLAKSLFFSSPSQARLEYRLAVEQDASLVPAVVADIDPLIQSYDDAFELCPDGASGSNLIDAMSGRIESRLPATSSRLDVRVLSQAPRSFGSLSRKAAHAYVDLADGEGAPWCADVAACAAPGLDAAAQMQVIEPNATEGYVSMARIYANQGKPQEAYRTLENATVTDSDLLVRWVAIIANEAHDEAKLKGTLERIRRAGCDGQPTCIDNLMYAAGLEGARGDHLGVLAFCRRARSLATAHRAAVECVGHSAEQLKLYAEAADAYEWLSRKFPSETQWALSATRAKAAAAHERLGTLH